MKTATEILAWCVENNEPNDFAIMANYSGHVNWLSVEVYLGGYGNARTHRENLGYAFTTGEEDLKSLFERLETLKYYNDQSSQWANELAENNKQRKIADLKLKLSELEG